jgi:hypothetical protein
MGGIECVSDVACQASRAHAAAGAARRPASACSCLHVRRRGMRSLVGAWRRIRGEDSGVWLERLGEVCCGGCDEGVSDAVDL